jgi:hypothetical protein
VEHTVPVNEKHSCAPLPKQQCCNCPCHHNHVHFYYVLTTITIIPTCAPGNRYFLIFFFILVFLRERWMVDCYNGYGDNGGDCQSRKGRAGGKLLHKGKCMGQRDLWVDTLHYLLGDVDRDGRKQLVNAALEDGQKFRG